MNALDAVIKYAMPGNAYERNIHKGAREMIESDRWWWIYSTQWGNGTIVWTNGDPDALDTEITFGEPT